MEIIKVVEKEIKKIFSYYIIIIFRLPQFTKKKKKTEGIRGRI